MTCTCGDDISIDAGSREEAVLRLKEMMDDEAVMTHVSESHSGESAPTMEEIHAMIEQTTKEVSELTS